MMHMPVGVLTAHGNRCLRRHAHQLSVPNPFGSQQQVSQFVNLAAGAAHRKRFETIVVVKVHVHRRHDNADIVMLDLV